MTDYYKKDKKQGETNSVWLQITAGQGPKECGWVVAQVLKVLLKHACTEKLNADLIESLAFDKELRKQNLVQPDSYRSVLIRCEGENALAFAQSWVGTIKWHGESPYRPKHKRINWFVGVERVDVSTIQPIELQALQKSITVETMRSRGPGGQHVNKTNSAVRITHNDTGIQIRVESARSQHQNRQLAIERLHMMLASGCEQDEKLQERVRWLNHYQVQRGSPTRIFHGIDFIERTV